MERANALHAAYPMIDGHNDLPWEFRAQVKDKVMEGADTLELRQRLDAKTMTDLPRLA